MANNREYFHESVVKDIIDVITSLKDFDEVQLLVNANKNRSFKSISSATKDLILTFPMMASADLDPESVMMAAKAHEKKCAAMLHILFTAICVDQSEDVYDYIRKFHSNIGTLDATLDDYTDALDRLGSMAEGYEQTMTINKDVLNAVLEDLKQSNYTLPDDIEEGAISDFKFVPGYMTGRDDMIIHEWLTPQDRKYIKNAFDKSSQNFTKYKDDLEGIVNNMRNTANQVGRDAIKSSKDAAEIRKFNTETINKTVMNAEYKKANELMPTMMVVNFLSKTDRGVVTQSTCVIGVKVKIYPVSSSDIIDHLSSKIQDRSVLTNFIRATTNEIAFFRDFLLAVDKAKLDALSYGKDATSNKLWKVLERRSVKSKLRRAMHMYNDATAITTLCMSEQVAKDLKIQSGIDIMNVATARKILDSYNFMAIVVLNEALEVANFLYDSGDDNYERLTFSAMERESGDNSYKKIVNLLTKMNR